MMIPENAPVRLLNAQLEELEYGKLYEAYSSKGRKSAADPRVLFKVLVHGYLCGIYSSRKMEEACRYRIDFKWLLEEEDGKIAFVSGKGGRKGQAQREWETKKALLERWEKYEEMLSIMGQGRNSYAKTDTDATFMRMKEDHMRNGQLKPGYNVQIAVNSEYITGLEVFSDRSDVKTLCPILNTLSRWHKAHYEEVVADAGYESLENYLYLEQNGQMCFIKPANYDQKKTSKFCEQVGRIENMEYDPEEGCFRTGWPLDRRD